MTDTADEPAGAGRARDAVDLAADAGPWPAEFAATAPMITVNASRPATAVVTPSRVGNDHLNIAPYQPLAAKDGLIIVAVANPALWDGLSVSRIGSPPCAGTM